MPRNPSSCTVSDIAPKLPENQSRQAYANMGYVGFVKLNSDKLNSHLSGSIRDQTLRVTDFSVGLSQDIEKPDVVDGRIDRTVYRLGPKIVEGTMSMPVVVDTFQRGSALQAGDNCPNQEELANQGENSEAGRMIQMLWCWSTSRDKEGRIAYDDMEMQVRYANHAAFKYGQCQVNELTLNVAQGDMITADVGVYGRSRIPFETPSGPGDAAPYITDYLAPARILTWNDVTVTGITGCSGTAPGVPLFYSNTVRTWNMTVANNLDRFYTFNGSLFPADINAGVRDVTGSLEFMGLNDNLKKHTSGADGKGGLQTHFTEKNELRFAFYIGAETFVGGNTFDSRDWLGVNTVAPGSPIFSRRLLAVIFEIEEISLTNDLFVSTINFHCMATDDDAYYEFVTPATSYQPVWYQG